MLELTTGNLLQAETDALVNTVNTVGVMGKGIALQFKKAFPENFKAYKAACDRKEVRLGKMFVYEHSDLHQTRHIINFPTKGHWRGQSKLEDIELGLGDLRERIIELNISSIAVPPLGCGHGGLPWHIVREAIMAELGGLEGVHVLLYEPKGAPAAADMPNRTPNPRMTPGRAAIVGLLSRYTGLGYTATLLEAQKLAYFLQVAGENLRLKFARETYGPYADNMRHALIQLEGHYILGLGDGSSNPKVELELMEGAAGKAEEFLDLHPDTRARFDRVENLIDGFESPYGMELLATVHWVADEDFEVANDSQAAVRAVHAWSARKRKAFKPEHIEIAWNRLREQDWLK